MGVHYAKDKKRWVARSTMVKGKRVYLGAFKTRDEAKSAFTVYELTKRVSSAPELHQVKVEFVAPEELPRPSAAQPIFDAINNLAKRFTRKKA